MLRALAERIARARWFGSATAWFLLYFLLGSVPALAVADVTIDPSWMAFLSLAADRHWVFGEDLIFSYGPLGHLLAGSYIGRHFHLLQLSHFAHAAALALMLALVSRSLPAWPRVLVSLAYLLAGPLDWALIGPALFGLWLLKEDKGTGYWLYWGAFCAMTGLVKFNYFIYYTCLCGVFVLAAFCSGRRLRAAVVALALGAWILVFWWAGGGPPGRFLPWFRETFNFTLSYNQILAWTSPIGVWLFSFWWLALLFILGAAIAHASVGEKGHSHIACLAAALCAAALSWKHGFTRGYQPNYAGFFATTALLPLFFYLPTRLTPKAKPILAGCMAAGLERVGRYLRSPVKTALWCLFFASIFQIMLVLIGPRALLKERFSGLPRLANYLLRNQSCRDQYERRLEAQRSRWSLGRVTQIVGRATVDLLGQDQSLVVLNNLNSRPRPYFQSYCAVAPEAQRRNAAFYHGASAPEFVLSFLNPMENRLPAMEDGLCLRELLAHYDYAETAVLREFPYAWLPQADAEVALFRRGTGVIDEQPTPLAAASLGWGERVRIPASQSGGVVWLRLDAQPNALGRAGYAVCRPPNLKIALYRQNSFLGEFLLVPAACASGFIIGPLFRQSRDLAQFAPDATRGQYPDSFAITTDTPRLLRRPARYELSEFPRRSKPGS